MKEEAVLKALSYYLSTTREGGKAESVLKIRKMDEVGYWLMAPVGLFTVLGIYVHDYSHNMAAARVLLALSAVSILIMVVHFIMTCRIQGGTNHADLQRAIDHFKSTFSIDIMEIDDYEATVDEVYRILSLDPSKMPVREDILRHAASKFTPVQAPEEEGPGSYH